MWTVFVFRGVAVLCDGDGHIVTYAVSARGARLHALADRLNARAAGGAVLPLAPPNRGHPGHPYHHGGFPMNQTVSDHDLLLLYRDIAQLTSEEGALERLLALSPDESKFALHLVVRLNRDAIAANMARFVGVPHAPRLTSIDGGRHADDPPTPRRSCLLSLAPDIA